MKKSVLIVIGIVLAIVIAGVVYGLTKSTENETKNTQNSTNAISTQPPPVTHGKKFSVNLAENVGIGAH